MANIVVNEVSQNYTYNVGNSEYCTVALPITACWGPAYTYGESAEDAPGWKRFRATRSGVEEFIRTYRGPSSLYRAAKDYSYHQALTLLTSGYDVLVYRLCPGEESYGDIGNLHVTAKYPGTFGNNIEVAVMPSNPNSSTYTMVVYVLDSYGNKTALENISFVYDESYATDAIPYIADIESSFINVYYSNVDGPVTGSIKLSNGTDSFSDDNENNQHGVSFVLNRYSVLGECPTAAELRDTKQATAKRYYDDSKLLNVEVSRKWYNNKITHSANFVKSPSVVCYVGLSGATEHKLPEPSGYTISKILTNGMTAIDTWSDRALESVNGEVGGAKLYLYGGQVTVTPGTVSINYKVDGQTTQLSDSGLGPRGQLQNTEGINKGTVDYDTGAVVLTDITTGEVTVTYSAEVHGDFGTSQPGIHTDENLTHAESSGLSQAKKFVNYAAQWVQGGVDVLYNVSVTPSDANSTSVTTSPDMSVITISPGKMLLPGSVIVTTEHSEYYDKGDGNFVGVTSAEKPIDYDSADINLGVLSNVTDATIHYITIPKIDNATVKYAGWGTVDVDMRPVSGNYLEDDVVHVLLTTNMYESSADNPYTLITEIPSVDVYADTHISIYDTLTNPGSMGMVGTSFEWDDISVESEYVKLYMLNATNLSKLQPYLEWLYTSACGVYSELNDKLSYSPNRIMSPGWDDQDMSIFGTVTTTSLGVSPIHSAIMNAAYHSRCAAGYIDVPVCLRPTVTSEESDAIYDYAVKLSGISPNSLSENDSIFATHSAMFAPWCQYTYAGMSRPARANPSFIELLLRRSMILNQSLQYEWVLPSSRVNNIKISKPDYRITRTLLNRWQGDSGVGINVITNLPDTGTTIWGNSTLWTVPPATYNALQNLSTRLLMNALKNIVYISGINISFSYNNSEAYSRFHAACTPLLDAMKSAGAIDGYYIRMEADINGLDQVNANSAIGKIYLVVNGVINNITVDLIALPPGTDLTQVQ